jgi:transposase
MTPSSIPLKAVLGIDISKSYFDVTLLKLALKGKDPKTVQKRFDNTAIGFNELKVWLKERGIKQVHACMESTGRYGDELALWLHLQKHPVSVVNPAVIHAYAKVQLRRNKTDTLDADLIARYCLSQRPQLWVPPAQDILDLQALLKCLADLQTTRQQEANRLESIIPCPQAAAFVQQHIDFLDAQIATLKAHIKTTPVFASQIKLLISIPGIGFLTAMRLIAFDLLRFHDANAAVAMAGLNPCENRSGSSVHRKSRLSKRGHADIRKALYMPAITAIIHNPFIRDLAARLAKNSKPPLSIIGAAMHKLVRQAFGVLKSNRPFDPSYSPRSLQNP